MDLTKKISCKLIVAACEGNGIGKSGNLPWRLKSEMAYFAKMTKTTEDSTKKNAVIMGRKTWQSIPEKFRPLKERLNVVLSTQSKQDVVGGDSPDVVVCNSLEEAFSSVEAAALDNKIESCWIIGGSSVYEEALKHPKLDKVYLTKILKEFDCDTFFPSLDEKQWKIVQEKDVPNDIQEENDIQFKYCVYQRV